MIDYRLFIVAAFVIIVIGIFISGNSMSNNFLHVGMFSLLFGILMFVFEEIEYVRYLKTEKIKKREDKKDEINKD